MTPSTVGIPMSAPAWLTKAGPASAPAIPRWACPHAPATDEGSGPHRVPDSVSSNDRWATALSTAASRHSRTRRSQGFSVPRAQNSVGGGAMGAPSHSQSSNGVPGLTKSRLSAASSTARATLASSMADETTE